MKSIYLHTSAPRRQDGRVSIAHPGETLRVAVVDEDTGKVIAHNEIDRADAIALVEAGGAEWVDDDDTGSDNEDEGDDQPPAGTPDAGTGAGRKSRRTSARA